MKNISIVCVYFLFVFVVCIKSASAAPIGVIVPFRLDVFGNNFSSLQITSYIDPHGETHPLNGPLMTQGDSYATPRLTLGDYFDGESLSFVIRGEYRARNQIPMGEDIIIPFGIRYDVTLVATPSGAVIGDVVNMFSQQVTPMDGVTRAINPEIITVRNLPMVFLNNERMSEVTRISIVSDNAAAALVMPDLIVLSQ